MAACKGTVYVFTFFYEKRKNVNRPLTVLQFSGPTALLEVASSSALGRCGEMFQ